MNVPPPPPDPGASGWAALLPDPPAPQPLEGAQTADWLVIGAGIAGLSAARRLSMRRRGDRIVLLDASRLGAGPAGRNSGFMIDLPHDLASANYAGQAEADRAQIADNRAAIDFALETAEAFALPPEAIARSGKINAAAGPRGLAHNADFARHLGSLGEAYEMLDGPQMREITGTGYYQGGLFTPHAAMVQPAIYVRGVGRGLASNAVSIHEESPVRSLTRQGGAWVAETPQGRVTAPRAVLAVNGLARDFGFFKGRLAHVYTWASMTRALTAEEARVLGGHPNWGATPADPLGTTVRRVSGQGGDRIVIRNRFHYSAGGAPPRDWERIIAAEHDRAFTARFPMLGDVRMEHRWGGRLCLSRNDAPAFGEVAEGLFAACCQNGLGLARGTFAGIAAADLAMGEETRFSARLSAAPAPRRLPPEPIAWAGATAKIRWGERMAGREL